MIQVATHSGRFHADDVYAVAVLQLYYEKQGDTDLSIVRTRDQDMIRNADVIVDVGKEFDPSQKKFDHHQNGLTPRENGIPYASLGLVWREFGVDVCDGDTELADLIDRVLAQPIDANDNGMKLSERKHDSVGEYTLFHFINSYVPTWQEEQVSMDDAFSEAVTVARHHLLREIKRQQAVIEAREKVLNAYKTAEDKRIIVLPQKYPWKEVLLEFNEPQLVIYPVTTENDEVRWYIQTVPMKADTFENKVQFPEEWAGKSDGALQNASGIDDLVFAHKGRFLVVANTQEAAYEVAEITLK